MIKLSKELSEQTGFNWEIVNEFYAPKWNNFAPFASTEDAISHWAETITAIDITLDHSGELRLFAPYGISDLINFIVRPTPIFVGKMDVFKNRVKKRIG